MSHSWPTTCEAVSRRCSALRLQRMGWRQETRTPTAARKSESDVSLVLRECGGGGRWRCKGDQQFEKSVEPISAEVTHGLLGGLGYTVIEPTQKRPACRSDSVDASTPILGIGLSYDESFALETRDQASQIRISRDHALSDLVAG